VASLLALPALPGAPGFDAVRVELLGRARGEPLVLVREPMETPDASLAPSWITSRRLFEHGQPGRRVKDLVARHRADPHALRAILLREGYLYTSEPLDALATVTSLHLDDLFDEPELWLDRGSERQHLARGLGPRERAYRIADGPGAGRAAELLFGDRVATSPDDLGSPLHRDVRALSESYGFDRVRIVHRTADALVADVRFGARWARTVLDAEGASLHVGCIAEDEGTRAAIEAWRSADEPRRAALARLRDVIGAEVDEALRFDRPEGEKTSEYDGLLRPLWFGAYMRGATEFDLWSTRLPVYSSDGRPWPPQVCVDFVLDSYERAAGTWFAPRGQPPARVRGALDFDAFAIKNRRGVLAFEQFAEAHPELFEHRRFEGNERIQFLERARFFSFLVAHAESVRPGDVVAIQGIKADGNVHQHAILVEHADPLTGFPYGLADQMFRSRRRTWEGIMAEAPLRSLLYRVRPTDRVLGPHADRSEAE
jgi:hypothetical protein